MKEAMTKIILSGVLGKTFGKIHYRLISTVHEAGQALSATIPGFEKFMITSKERGLTYAVFKGEKNIGKDDLGFPVGGEVIRIVPVLIGSKKAGLLQTILGAVIIVASAVGSYFVPGSLNTSLQSQIDAQAAANIKNQTTLDNTIKSVASITSTQQTHATALEALATQQTTLTSSVGDLSASVQNTAKTVADVNGTVSLLWSMKVETVNGKNVGAGITLGSNGQTSDMILYADRFSLFNRNNATAVPVMIAEGNELYIDTARIKNSSLTSTKIADGSITNAKIGNEIRSNNFVDGSQGWRIAKDGSSQFNNVIVRGRVEANSGVFRGTVQADAFIGDIAVAKGYDSLTFRRNQTVQRNGAYQNRGYSMTVVLACTLVCQTYGTGSGLGYTSDITFNIGGQEVTRRIFVDAGNITAGTTAFELRFAARLDADYNNVGFFIKATGRNAAIDYTCTVENITATAFRTDSSSFS